MKTGNYVLTLCIIVCFLLSPESETVYGQAADQKPAATEQSAPKDKTTINTLIGVIQSTEALQNQLREKERELQAAETEDQKKTIVNEMKELNERLEALKKNFETIATGVDLESFTVRAKKRFDWKEEIQEILGPIIEELKGITARPREIERLRTELAYYEKRLPIIEAALKNVRKLLDQTESEKLKKPLSVLRDQWEEKKNEFDNQFAVAKYQLEEKLKGEKSFVKTVQEVFQNFFKSRGLNLLLSLVAFVAVFLLFRFLYRMVFKISPVYLAQKRSFYSRLADVIYHVLTLVGATGAFLLVLYIFGDWVLLGLALIFLFGLAWTAKQALPLFWEQGKLLLNLSTVRENERVVYNGLPWKVASLNLYTRLHNPALKGGLIRLPLRELIGLHSRPFHKDEPWFPCQENDWVILADGTFGKVFMQTPEMVQLILLGGSRKTYPTTEFLQQSPNNLSTNFRLTVAFGIDYQHQAMSTREIPDMLQKMLKEELRNEGYGDDLINLKVEFKEAGTSSLDLAILADFEGRVAQDHDIIGRRLQRIAVDACNTYGWVIPFTQITLHTASSPNTNIPAENS